MNINTAQIGKNFPNECNVIIEIPAQSGPIKYEVDKESGLLQVDRFMSTAMFYPCNYGYVPKTLALDGDPMDVLVITPVPLISGSIIATRPIGVLHMTDESGEDAKILAVPTEKLLPMYQHIREHTDVMPHLLSMITHFFEHYKDLEDDKWVKVENWGSSDEAKAIIEESASRFSTK